MEQSTGGYATEGPVTLVPTSSDMGVAEKLDVGDPKGADDHIWIEVKPLDGPAEKFNPRQSDTVQMLKESIMERLGHPTGRQNLIFKKKALDELDALLIDCGLEEKSQVLLLLTPPPKVYTFYEKTPIYGEDERPYRADRTRIALYADNTFLLFNDFDSENSSEDRSAYWCSTDKFDVACGTFTLVEEDSRTVAICKFTKHFQRSIVENHYYGEEFEDKGWEEMDESASVKWQRIVFSDDWKLETEEFPTGGDTILGLQINDNARTTASQEPGRGQKFKVIDFSTSADEVLNLLGWTPKA